MSIEVRQLTKIYGPQRAVDQIDFSVKEGEVVGFLGPNGAGKSTTMKILTGYLQATEGSAKVCGIDVAEHPNEVKKLIGYLPEHNPLYLDMYVLEFLDFVARATKVEGRKERIEEVIGMTGLEAERKKKIGQLSKGYRQRVGLAQALLHRPRVLILDEPTSGLDPNQVQEIRKLILSLGSERTVLLSTHIMQEVEAMCNRVIIINKGKIVADDETSKVSERIEEQNSMRVRFKDAIDLAKLKDTKGVIAVDEFAGNEYSVSAGKGVDLAALLFQTAVDNGTIILEQRQERMGLESVFQKLTKDV